MRTREGHVRSFGFLRVTAVPVVTRERQGDTITCREAHVWESPEGLRLNLNVMLPGIRRWHLEDTTPEQRELAHRERRIQRGYLYEVLDPYRPQPPLPSAGGTG